ncbi:MAG: head GIN domain-containing protein [Anaerolineales bacterium]
MNKTVQKHLLAVLILTTLLLLACSITAPLGLGNTVRGSGNVVEETRTVSGVSGVELATLGRLFIEVGDTESLRIEAEDNLMEHFITEVRSGKLRIETENNIRLNPTEPVNYYLTVTGLDTIEISSSGDIQTPDLEADRFSVTISSSGDLEMGVLNADSLDVNISSSGNLDIAGGQVQTLDVTISSSGNYTAQDLASVEADVRLSSSGSATIWVQDSLKANLSSSGDLRYRGNPTINATTTSSGDVIQIGE